MDSNQLIAELHDSSRAVSDPRAEYVEPTLMRHGTITSLTQGSSTFSENSDTNGYASAT